MSLKEQSDQTDEKNMPAKNKDVFSEYIKLLPDLRNKYFPGDFFFNFYGKNSPVRIGCRYSDASLEKGMENENYLVIIETFKEKPEPEFFDSEKIKGNNILYGYIPKFPLAKKYLDENCNFASVTKENKIITFINLKKSEVNDFDDLPGLYSFFDAKKDKNLMNFLTKFLAEEKKIEFLPIFDFIEYLPEKAGEWKLTTFFCFYLNQEADGKNHLISNIQGNYEKKGKYLNLALRFIYKMSEGKISIELNGIEEKLENIKIKKNKTGNNLNLSYYNKKENFTAMATNNETTPKFEEYENELRNLLLATAVKLKNYSCIEQTMKFIENSKKLLKA